MKMRSTDTVVTLVAKAEISALRDADTALGSAMDVAAKALKQGVWLTINWAYNSNPLFAYD